MLTKVFGSRNHRTLPRMRKVVNIINAMEPEMEKLSDEELKGKTTEFRARLEKGEVLENLIPEAFAVVREASKRVFGMRHFDVQLLGGMVLNERCIAEMRTGEGKTLTATLPAYLNALTGKGVHVVTVNDYLAQRDAENNRPLFEFLGLTVGMTCRARQHRQSAKLTQLTSLTVRTTNTGFRLPARQHGVSARRVQRKLHYALVDEVDRPRIHEARTPRSFLARQKTARKMYKRVNKIIPHLIRQETRDSETFQAKATSRLVPKISPGETDRTWSGAD
ncbi:DEAD/DEAH box helicase [Escherichia coli]